MVADDFAALLRLSLLYIYASVHTSGPYAAYKSCVALTSGRQELMSVAQTYGPSPKMQVFVGSLVINIEKMAPRPLYCDRSTAPARLLVDLLWCMDCVKLRVDGRPGRRSSGTHCGALCKIHELLLSC
ncbi:hypothetical protein BD413DRAFT_227816 [Trametes elegans]|nr:hypothetical protein BD413DRAFT_227816 [Trametes elegans]